MGRFKRLTDETIMPWGRHKGEKLEDVPAGYLLWLDSENRYPKDRTDFTNGLLVYVEENREVLEKQSK